MILCLFMLRVDAGIFIVIVVLSRASLGLSRSFVFEGFGSSFLGLSGLTLKICHPRRCPEVTYSH